MLAPQSATFQAGRFGTLYDAQFDSGGRLLASAHADGVVRIWSAEKHEVLAELKGHRAPVLSLSWGQGRFAGTLASGSSDGQVVVWRLAKTGDWMIAHQTYITGSVSDLGFCPPDYGLVLAVAGTDDLGVVTMMVGKESDVDSGRPKNEPWQVRSFAAHEGGVTALSWAPSASPATLATGPAVSRAAPHATRRLVTCGADGAMRIWHGDARMEIWEQKHELSDQQHTGDTRDVAWRPNMGVPSSVLASCTQDGTVATWTQDMEGQPWRLRCCWKVQGDARRLAWSKAGSLLSVSVNENESLLYKEGQDGQWEKVCSYEE